MKSIRVDSEVLEMARASGETPNQGLRKLLGLPPTKHNKARKQKGRFRRILKILFEGR